MILCTEWCDFTASYGQGTASTIIRTAGVTAGFTLDWATAITIYLRCWDCCQVKTKLNKRDDNIKKIKRCLEKPKLFLIFMPVKFSLKGRKDYIL